MPDENQLLLIIEALKKQRAFLLENVTVKRLDEEPDDNRVGVGFPPGKITTKQKRTSIKTLESMYPSDVT